MVAIETAVGITGVLVMVRVGTAGSAGQGSLPVADRPVDRMTGWGPVSRTGMTRSMSIASSVRGPTVTWLSGRLGMNTGIGRRGIARSG